MNDKAQLSTARRELHSPNKKTHRRALKVIKAVKGLKKGLAN
ncbi:MAG: putative metal homeostasis protein [Sporolactobacillus sp.]